MSKPVGGNIQKKADRKTAASRGSAEK